MEENIDEDEWFENEMEKENKKDGKDIDIDEEFEKTMNKYKKGMDNRNNEDEIAVVPDDEVVTEFGETKLQYSGRSYSINIPIKVIKHTNLAKSDIATWDVVEDDENHTVIQMDIDKRGFRTDYKERIGGR